ncbi:hypothetical protein [Vibrio aestuarianus]|uniref:Uncharacterized protein n=1 Tax=Vibrio aestuarianus TaxID=28171 RepID=A0A9X4EU07_9VIBR|nr:hypothetical protein [Vibrio aestuarianus]MDE1240605.1 hypothetical protein [Vibrio aestuarianus]
MKMTKCFTVIMVILSSACADISSINRDAEEIVSNKLKLEEEFSSFTVSDSNYMDLKNNSSYPDGYWSLHIKTTHFNPVSIDVVLSDLAKRMNVSFFDKGNDENIKRSIKFEGSVEDYIQYLTDAYDVFIDIDKNKIVKRSSKTQIYKLYNSRYLKNESQYAFGSQAAGGGGGGFSGSIAIGGAVDLWSEVESYLDSIAEDSESFKYSIFQEFSQLSATGSKNELDSVKKFVNSYNKLASTEIKISYKIVTIDQKTLQLLGADIQGGSSTVGLKGTAGNGFGGNDVSSVLFGYAINSDHGIGGSLTAELLRSGAKIVSEGVAVSLNGKPVPVNAVNEVGYVSSVTRVPGDESNEAAQTVSTDTLETGMSFMIVPEVLTDGRVNITMGYSRKRLNKLASFGDDADSVQLPDISRNENINNLIIEEGKETVAAIFTEQQQLRGDFAGLVGKSMHDSESKNIVALIVRIDTKK